MSSVSSVSNQYHDTDAIKGGNSQASVASDGVDGSAAELDEATKAAMNLLKMGKPPNAA